MFYAERTVFEGGTGAAVADWEALCCEDVALVAHISVLAHAIVERVSDRVRNTREAI
jgi:hypothetical protein